MTFQLECPACRHLLYFPGFDECDEDFLESICTNCKYKYALIHTDVSSFTSSVEVLQTNKHRKQAEYRRIYQLRLLKADKTIQSLRFSTPGKEEKLSALPGDELLLLYVMRGQALAELISVKNYTTGMTCLLLAPGAKARKAGFRTGIATLVGGVLLAAFVNIPINKIFLATVLPPAVGVGVYTTRLKDPRTRERKELARLGSEQRLLLQKFELEQRTQDLRQDLESNWRMIDRLKNLRRKMQNAEEELYANRIETVSKGIKLLEKQLDLTQSLITGYTQVIDVMAIEYETSRLAEQLPEDIDAKILGKLDELKNLESEKEQLSLLINPEKLLSS